MLTPVVIRCVFRSQFDQKFAMLDAARENYSAAKSPSWTKGKGKEGTVREKKGWDETEKEEGGRGKGTLCPGQLQFLDQPVVTMGLSRTVSEKNTNFRQKIAFFYIGSLTPPA